MFVGIFHPRGEQAELFDLAVVRCSWANRRSGFGALLASSVVLHAAAGRRAARDRRGSEMSQRLTLLRDRRLRSGARSFLDRTSSRALVGDQTPPVFVIHWNAPDLIAGTIESLRASEGVVVDITVIDNASDLNLYRDMNSRVPSDVRIVRLDRNVGFAGAANEAIDRARGMGEPWFVIAAHDILVQPDNLKELMACVDADPGIGVAGPLLGDGPSSPSQPSSSGSGCLAACFSSGWSVRLAWAVSGRICSPTARMWTSAFVPAMPDGRSVSGLPRWLGSAARWFRQTDGST